MQSMGNIFFIRFSMYWAAIVLVSFEAQGISLVVPATGNCGEDTELFCQFNGTLANWGWQVIGEGAIIKNGFVIEPANADKYMLKYYPNSVGLIIKNTKISDAKGYRCSLGYNVTPYEELVFECKAKNVTAQVLKNKMLSITVDELYPNPTTLLVTPVPQVSGSHTCNASSQYPAYRRCVWTSTRSLTAGSYSYSVTVTTVTQTATITGTVRIVSPNQPSIFDTDVISNSRVVVRGVEGQPTTIQCVSRGGFPEPTVAWYQRSVSSGNVIASQSTGTKETNNTYTVTLNHQFTPTRQNDRQNYTCRSYYPQATSGYQDSNTATVLLYLALKPSQPVVSHSGPVNQGDDVTVTCTSSGSRPAPSVSWAFKGQTTTGTNSPTEDSATETVTIQSTLVRSVTKADNGQAVTCTINNQAFSPLSGSANLNVRFAPSNVSLEGDKVINANGVNPLELVCTSGSSNPVSTITWGVGNVPSSAAQEDDPSGEYGGIKRRSRRTFTPRRSDDGATITCTANNLLSSVPSPTDQITLNLNYEPMITMSNDEEAVEGQTATLPCQASSKPASQFTWNKGAALVDQGHGTSTSNRYDYKITTVNRTHAGEYTCRADNGIGNPASGKTRLSVQFRPLNVTLRGNKVIEANGQNPLELTCVSGSSNPASTITWNDGSGGQQDQTHAGEYDGVITESRKTLRPDRNDDGMTISCSASNALVSGSSPSYSIKLDLTYEPKINPIDDVQAVEGQRTSLPCQASSKPPSFFTWTRETSNVLEGSGTAASNQLDYEIADVNRTHAGTYTCTANNHVGMIDTKMAKLTVFYAPDVTVTTSTNTYKENRSLQINCSASGLPTNYTYGDFTQTLRGITVQTYRKRSMVQLQSLQLEHSGVYTCTASNGIPDRSGQENQHNNKHILVEVQPKILMRDTVVGAPGKPLTITIPFYSYPTHSFLSIKQDDRTLTKSSRITWDVSSSDVTDFFHGTEVTLDGSNVSLVIKNLTGDDFTNYTLEIQNAIGTTSWVFPIKSHSVPDGPSGFSLVISSTFNLTWISGFNGGYTQSFIVEISAVGTENWIQKLNISDGDVNHHLGNHSYTAVIDKDLSPGSYKARIYAQNKIGNSTLKDLETTFTIPEVKDEGRPPLAAIAGGVGSAVLVIFVVVGIFLIRRRYCQPEDKRRDLQDGKDNESFTPEIVENENYVSAGPFLPNTPSNETADNYTYSEVKKGPLHSNAGDSDVYATPMKKKGKKIKENKENPVTDVYATPIKKKGVGKKSGAKVGEEKKSKSKLGSKEKKGKPDKEKIPLGDIYENAPINTSTQALYANAGGKDNQVYEDVRVGASNQIQRHENKDGLIYLEIDFNNDQHKTAGNTIIGIDDMTEYGVIDFNKKANPLPDSDEEDKTEPKKSN